MIITLFSRKTAIFFAEKRSKSSKIYYCNIDPRPLQRVLELLLPPPGFEDFRWVLLAIIAGNIVTCVILEDVVVEVAFRKLQNWSEKSL
jgi:hypothetical protein